MKLDGHLMFFKFVFDFLPKFAGSELLKNLRKCNFLAFFFQDGGKRTGNRGRKLGVFIRGSTYLKTKTTLPPF